MSMRAGWESRERMHNRGAGSRLGCCCCLLTALTPNCPLYNCDTNTAGPTSSSRELPLDDAWRQRQGLAKGVRQSAIPAWRIEPRAEKCASGQRGLSN